MLRTYAVLVVLGMVAAGCVTSPDVAIDAAAYEGLSVAPVVIDVPVHLVRVGLAADAVDERALLDALPRERLPIVESIHWTTRELRHMPVLYRFSYEVHDAPAAFTEALFAKAAEHATTGRPNAWLIEYDCAGQQRLGACGPVAALDSPADVVYFDVTPVEEWLAAALPEHGLDFGAQAVTILLLDGESGGHVASDSYHYWHFDDGNGHADIPQSGLAPTVRAHDATATEHIAPYHTPKDPTSMRAWGGRSNFLWLDMTAAPSAYDFTPQAPVESWEDPPLWDVSPQQAAENLGRNLNDFLALRVARDPIYPVTAFTKFTTPIHVFVEEGAQENPDVGRGADLAAWVPQDEIRDSLARLMPWVEVDSPVYFHMLPSDDPGMSEAIKRARVYGSPAHVSSGYVQAYIRDHWAEYVPEAAPDEFVMPQFYYFFAGPWTFNGFGGAGGWADGDEEGHPWAIFDHFFDLCLRADVRPCTKNDMGFANLTILPLHEAGHELGLTHTKDRLELDDETGTAWKINWLWDSMLSQMSYRHTFPEFDHWDRVFLATSHAADLIERTELLGGDASEPRRLLREGRHQEAVSTGWTALRAAQAAGAQPAAIVEESVVVDTQVVVPASAGVVPFSNLGVAFLASPAYPFVEGVSMVTIRFDVPEGARQVRVEYEDITPMALAVGRSSDAYVYDANGEYVGATGRDFEGAVVLRPESLPAGEWYVEMAQWSGTPGTYALRVSVG